MAIIEVSELEKIYNEKGSVPTPALRGLSFSIEEGSFVAIMGPSGSGKSTLLHILGFLDRQTKGSYRFEGKAIEDYSDTQLSRVRNKSMGFVFQTFNLLPNTSVLENVKLPLLYSGVKESLWNEMAEHALESVGLGHRMGHKSAQLSGGERQRVAIARALINHPRVIFADEPTGNLDSKSGQAVMGILQDLNIKEKHTVVLVTHETYTAEHAERIIHMLDGKIERDEAVTYRRSEDDFIK
ncbi:MAG: ABC transporter ATP-binding protein [Patescibacteria group bacterium]|nr:ABC transporter ATP-binding protein [Patescibacteria group bacterium]MDE2438558.1 ABC transporter ATP-binding protein [Patescibacteria group bacterium]